MTAVIQKFRPPEGEPISASILNKSIETAQKRIEQRNYVIRKHTLEYDDVMNKQRQEIYGFRNDVIHEADIIPLAVELLEQVCLNESEKYFKSRSEEGGWDPEGYRQWLIHHFPISFEEGFFDQEFAEADELAKQASEKIVAAFNEKLERENSKFPHPPEDDQSNRTRHKPAHEAVRNLMIRKIDKLWQEHLLNMDHLRVEVNMRTVGQRDPLTEFKHEAFELFYELSQNLRNEIAQDLFKFELIVRRMPTLDQLLSLMHMEKNRSFTDDLVAPPKAQPQEAPEQEIEQKVVPITAGPKYNRNDLCPCGSGKKYKKCCGQSGHEDE
jgi:preprotein translocase subunit SecA